MIISVYANKLGLLIRGSQILPKWLWLESQVIDCDSSRFESPSFSTWLESNQSHQKSWLDSIRVIDSSHAITAPWHGMLETVWLHCDEAQQGGCLRG